jgi:hypothetical protein
MLESSQKEHLNIRKQLTKHAMLFFITHPLDAHYIYI